MQVMFACLIKNVPVHSYRVCVVDSLHCGLYRSV